MNSYFLRKKNGQQKHGKQQLYIFYGHWAEWLVLERRNTDTTWQKKNNNILFNRRERCSGKFLIVTGNIAHCGNCFWLTSLHSFLFHYLFIMAGFKLQRVISITLCNVHGSEMLVRKRLYRTIKSPESVLCAWN